MASIVNDSIEENRPPSERTALMAGSSTLIDDGSDFETALDGFVKEEDPFFSRLSPAFILIFIVLCQMVNYFDRGAVSGLVKALSLEFELSKFEAGMIGGAFMLGYMVFAPTAGFLTQYIRGTRIMAAGLVLWIGAAIFASLSWHLYAMLGARVMLGLGEATFASIAPAIIDDISVPRTRSLWLAIYFMAVPVGQALGFIAAGFFSTLWSWRVVFILEAILMVPFPVICFFLPEISVIVENGIRKLNHVDRAAKEAEVLRTDQQVLVKQKRSLLNSLRNILNRPVYIFVVLGYSCLTFTLGGMTFWAADFFHQSLTMELDRVTLIFGILGAVAGLAGAVSGGLIMDRLGGTAGPWGIPKALALCALFALPATGFGAICVLTDLPGVAFPLVALASFCMCVTFAPINGVVMKVAPVDLRAFAMSLNLFAVHFLGDFPSPVLTGWIADSFVSESCTVFCGLRWAMLILMCWCTGAVVFWGIGFVVAVVQSSKTGEFLGTPSDKTEQVEAAAESEDVMEQ